MLDNVDLFNECFSYPAKNVDPFARESLNKMILPIDDELLKKNKELIELLNDYQANKKKGDRKHLSETINDIDQCLKCTGMNFCNFSQYLMVHNVTYDMYLRKLTTEEKEYIIDCYLEDRHQLYCQRGYSETIFQVLTDNYSHKRKGQLGIKKLEKICSDLKIPKINDSLQIGEELYYILPDYSKADKKLFNEIVNINNVKFEFRLTHQGKMPDALIKVNDKFLIVEHKIMKQSGGGQDKQITEIIDFIGKGERYIHYVSFMDGILFNELNNPSINSKIYTDKQNIINNLRETLITTLLMNMDLGNY